MKLGKLLLGAGVVTSALAVSAGFGVQSASAEDAATAIDIAKIAINYGEQNIVVKEAASDTADKKLYVGIGTYSAKTPTDVKVKKWIEYDNDTTNGVTIDTSSLAVTKTQYVVIKGDKNTKEVAIQLAATPSKLAASIDYTDPAAPALSLKDITKGKSSATAVKNVEFSVANGSKYTTYTAKTDSAAGTDLTKYQKLGATLKVRQAASTDIDALNKTDSTGNCKEVDIKLNGEAAKAYAATGTFASKELKVKVAKLASGPKITVNYTKNTVSIPKTAEYRTAVGVFANDLVKGATKNTVVVPLAEFKQDAAFTLDVRTAAKTNDKDKTKSKSASNITEVVVPASTKCVSKVAGASADTDAEIDKTNFGTADLEKVTANGKVTLKYTGVGKTTATLTNADTENAYDVYVTTDSTVGFAGAENAYVAPASTVTGAKKLAAGKTLKLTKLKDGDKIFIRVAGNAKKKTFASEYGAFGTVSLPKATPAPTATATGK